MTSTNDRDADLDAEHEGDPLVVGGVGGFVRALDALLLHDAPEVGLVLRRDVGAAVDPAVVLGHLRADALELATGKNNMYFFQLYLFYSFYSSCTAVLFTYISVYDPQT